jgi:integrase
MASLISRANGSREISYTLGDTRPVLRLGNMPKKTAESVKVHVERLVSAKRSNGTVPDDTAAWLAGVGDDLYGKLVTLRLVPERAIVPTLEQWIVRFLAEKSTTLKPGSMAKLKQTTAKLVKHFGRGVLLSHITTSMAADWRAAVRKGVSEASTKIHAGNAKGIFAGAVSMKLIGDNPFLSLRSGATPSRYTRYVTPAEFEKVLNELPSLQHRVLFALARYAGLRCTSESRGLTWQDIDWSKSTMLVRSPKTEHHTGHESRVVPISPRLMVLLRERFDASPEGSVKVLTLTRYGSIHEMFRRTCARANVEPWERIFQTLRSSCEKEWAMEHPQFAVSKWIGHSITVSGRHYANAVPDELLSRVTKVGHEQAQQNAQQYPPEPSGMASQMQNARKATPSKSPDSSETFNTVLAGANDSQMQKRGLEPLRLSALAPKTSASANFATSAAGRGSVVGGRGPITTAVTTTLLVLCGLRFVNDN